FRRQCVHHVAEQRAVIRIGIEVEFAAAWAQLVLYRFEDLVPIVDEGMVVGPDFLDDFHPRILAVGVNRNEPSARTERPRQRYDYALGLEFERCPRPIRL